MSVTSLNKERHISGVSNRLGEGIMGASVASDLNNSGRTRKAKAEAPKPPGFNRANPSQKNSNATFQKFDNSLEDLTKMDVKRRNEIKRSASNNGNRPTQGM